MNGLPERSDFGVQASETSFRPASDSLVCADELARLAVKVMFSSWSISELLNANSAAEPNSGTWTKAGTLTCVLLDDN